MISVSFVSLLLIVCASSDTRPNIIVFLTDDWGFNDVGYHGNTNTQTPFIDSLVKEEGLIIDKFYAYPTCTISRCALLTGRYPMRYGMQKEVLNYESNYGLSKYETLISEEFISLGYNTHLIGKWHIGMLHNEYLPLSRGFNTFFGYYGASMYYNEHYGIDDYYTAYDLYDNNDQYYSNLLLINIVQIVIRVIHFLCMLVGKDLIHQVKQ